MKIHKGPDPERLHVLAQSLRLWLMDVCVWLAEWLGVKLPRDMRMEMRRELARALRRTRMLVLLLAVSRMHIPVVTPRTMRPASAPPGFRLARRGGGGRGYDRGVRLPGRTLAARLRALRDLFDNLGAAVQRMLKHLRKRWRGACLCLSAPVCECLRPLAHVMPDGVDTS